MAGERRREQRQSDFRAVLYERYVSSFKGVNAAPASSVSDAGQGLYWTWCEHKYGPLLAGLPSDAPILELGCGPGPFMAYLRRRGFSHVRGIDVAPEQVALARQHGLDAECADVFEALANRTQPRPALLVAIDFLEHFSKDELLRLAEACATALAPGGRLLIQTANGQGLFPGQVMYGDLTHLTILSPGSLAQLLRPFGFQRFTFAETGPAPIGLRGKVDAALWAAVKAGANAVRRIETGKTQGIWTENFICLAELGPN